MAKPSLLKAAPKGKPSLTLRLCTRCGGEEYRPSRRCRFCNCKDLRPAGRNEAAPARKYIAIGQFGNWGVGAIPEDAVANVRKTWPRGKPLTNASIVLYDCPRSAYVSVDGALLHTNPEERKARKVRVLPAE